MSENRPVSPINGQPLPEGAPPFQPGEQAREAGRKGGLKSAAKRAARKTLREELEILLSQDIHDKNGRTMNTQTAMSTSIIKAALNGSVRAFEVIRDTVGEKPVENVTVTAGNFDALEEAFAALQEDHDAP